MQSDSAMSKVNEWNMGSLSSIEFVKVNPEWEQPLAEFFRVLEKAGEDIQFHPHPMNEDTAKELASYTGKDLYYIAVESLRVVGYGMLRGWDQGYEVPSLGIALHPIARGTGLAKVFMGFLHEAAQYKGAKRIRLKVYPWNKPAVRLYKALGYQFEHIEAGELVGFLDLTHE